MSSLKIIMPTGAFGGSSGEGLLATAMRIIGVGFSTEEDEWPAKYGTNVENDAFLMHKYCWCEKEGECPWCTGCGIYQERNECNVCSNEALSIEDRRNAAPELRCDYSAGRGIFARFAPWSKDRKRHYYDPPNFWFKPTNFRLTWYKYIGRDMESNRDDLSGDFMERIFATHPKGMTVAEAVAETARQEEASAESFRQMFADLGVAT